MRATVTQASPLMVRVEAATRPTAAEWAGGPVAVGTRVLVVEIGGKLLCVGGSGDLTWRQVGAAGQPTFTGGASQFTDLSFGPVAFRLEASGVVTMRGLITVPTANSVVFTLPVGYRPATAHILPVATSAGYGELRVQASGDVQAQAAVSWVSLAAVRFLAEQ